MTTLYFHLADGELSVGGSTKSWRATSGPWGNGALPAGNYRVMISQLTRYTSAIGKGFQDVFGRGFFLPIEPLFSSFPKRTSLGIHPDGNVPGTQGCIGLDPFDSQSFYDWAVSLPLWESVFLEVR